MFRSACLSALVLLATTTCARAAMPDLSTVETLERSVELPASAGRLDAYDRYYALETISGRRLIVGLYQKTRVTDERERYERGEKGPLRAPPPRQGRLSLLEHASSFLKFSIMDGGCSEIHVYWDIASARITRPECNGLG